MALQLPWVPSGETPCCCEEGDCPCPADPPETVTIDGAPFGDFDPQCTTLALTGFQPCEYRCFSEWDDDSGHHSGVWLLRLTPAADPPWVLSSGRDGDDQATYEKPCDGSSPYGTYTLITLIPDYPATLEVVP